MMAPFRANNLVQPAQFVHRCHIRAPIVCDDNPAPRRLGFQCAAFSKCHDGERFSNLANAIGSGCGWRGKWSALAGRIPHRAAAMCRNNRNGYRLSRKKYRNTDTAAATASSNPAGWTAHRDSCARA